MTNLAESLLMNPTRHHGQSNPDPGAQEEGNDMSELIRVRNGLDVARGTTERTEILAVPEIKTARLEMAHVRDISLAQWLEELVEDAITRP
jgi:hypothetical protein